MTGKNRVSPLWLISLLDQKSNKFYPNINNVLLHFQKIDVQLILPPACLFDRMSRKASGNISTLAVNCLVSWSVVLEKTAFLDLSAVKISSPLMFWTSYIIETRHCHLKITTAHSVNLFLWLRSDTSFNIISVIWQQRFTGRSTWDNWMDPKYIWPWVNLIMGCETIWWSHSTSYLGKPQHGL